MSTPARLLLALLSVSCAALIAYLFWNPRTSIIVCLSLLAGVALGTFVSGTAKEASALAATSPLKKRDPASEAQATSLLSAMLDSMREGVLVVDEEMRVAASNNAAREIFNHMETSLKGARLSSLTRSAAIHAAFRAALEEDESTEVKLELPGDERRSLDVLVVPLKAQGKQDSRRAIGVFFDITRLERLEQVRQEFLTNVSHELRTPLTSIIAYVETLEDGAIEDEAHNRRFLSVIGKNAVRMHHLINDLLELSSIEAGAASLHVERVSLRPLVEDIITALAVKAEERRIRLHSEIAEEAIVEAAPRRLEQMLTNLIDNAIKFNREGGSVTIAFEGGGRRDRISVRDTGEGISGEHLERVFERLYRVDRARSNENGGNGLGLAIVKHLARAHGGEVSLRSTPGEGSTFVIELPKAK